MKQQEPGDSPTSLQLVLTRLIHISAAPYQPLLLSNSHIISRSFTTILRTEIQNAAIVRHSGVYGVCHKGSTQVMVCLHLLAWHSGRCWMRVWRARLLHDLELHSTVHVLPSQKDNISTLALSNVWIFLLLCTWT